MGRKERVEGVGCRERARVDEDASVYGRVL